jgi:hypothetical protein
LNAARTIGTAILTSRRRQRGERRIRIAHRSPASAEPATLAEHRQSKLWWAVPLDVLALLIFVPIAVGSFIWLQNRRARREYLRSSGRA